ncbi:MAG: hypothetical protein ACNS62_23115 [Candidatus Cyclobacteriaceae bacterium M3_2C_046]
MNLLNKMTCLLGLLLCSSQLFSQKFDLEAVTEIDLGKNIGQLRAVPVNLGEGQPKAICAMYSEDAEIDPFIAMFFFPQHTLKLVLFTEQGEVIWHRDLGPGVVPGVWFSPVYAMDLDQNGQDEIYIINNEDPAHPLNYTTYVLEQIDSKTGEALQQLPWPKPPTHQRMSHLYRHFILGGNVQGQPVLITAQGTYGPMAIQAWNQDFSKRWELEIPADSPGASGSHVNPVVDINQDGTDDLLWGERCIELDQGKELFCADQENWDGHSDIVQPVLDRNTNQWMIHTCREEFTQQPPRIVMFDQQGNIKWSALDQGHIDTGWAARIGDNGAPVVLGVRVGKKIRTAEGETRTNVEEFTYDAVSGKPVQLGFDVYTSIPVDINGDGIHELVKGYFEGNGDVLDRKGNNIGNIGGLAAMASKFTSRPGEQILSYSKGGKIKIWADKNAIDSPAGKARYQHPFYEVNQRLTGCGYNLFNLGGI